MEMKDIGNMIRIVRLEEKMTQEELAEKIGVYQQQINAYEHGQNMTMTTLFDVCDGLEVKPVELLQFIDIRNRYKNLL